MNRHDELKATWAPGQRWETLVENCTQWVPVADGGRAEPVWNDRQEYRQMAADAPARPVIDEARMSEMVNRFLGWKLPETFGPDCFVSFDRERAKANHSWPVGTNLFSASEAREMLEYVLRGST